MNDTKLADKIIACGVGESTLGDEGELYRFDDSAASWSFDDTADIFVRDWLVAGAMIELVEANSKTSDTAWAFGKALAWFRDGQTSLPRAINEACVEALNE